MLRIGTHSLNPIPNPNPNPTQEHTVTLGLQLSVLDIDDDSDEPVCYYATGKKTSTEQVRARMSLYFVQLATRCWTRRISRRCSC